MNYTNLGGSIFNLDHIVMVEPYDNGETISGWAHCTDGHTYIISESEYRTSRTIRRNPPVLRTKKGKKHDLEFTRQPHPTKGRQHY